MSYVQPTTKWAVMCEVEVDGQSTIRFAVAVYNSEEKAERKARELQEAERLCGMFAANNRYYRKSFEYLP